VDDETGVALVYPSGAECKVRFGVEEQCSGLALPECYTRYMSEQGLAMRHFWRLSTLRFRERVLEEGQRLYVLGTAWPGSSSHRISHSDAVDEAPVPGSAEARIRDLDARSVAVVRRGERERTFILSQDSERELVLGLGFRAFGSLLAGPALTLFGLAQIIPAPARPASCGLEGRRMMPVGEVLVTVLVGFAIVGAIGYVLSVYNSLVALKNSIARSWANIDVLLKQRHDELPKLVKTCEGYMRHERAVFDRLSEARGALVKAHTVGQRAAAESLLSQALGQFFAVAEAYPTLKADTSFLQLQNRISELENQIADRREFYNDTVTTFNTRIQQIPDLYVANWLSLRPADLFRVGESDRADVEIRFEMTG
jgi:LemA protein